MRIKCYETLLDRQTLRPLAVCEKACNYQAQKKLDNPEKIVSMLCDVFQHDVKTEEHTYMLAFNAKMDLLGVFQISIGTVDTAYLSPREVFVKALAVGAVSIVIAHNHPSGDVTPSKEDKECVQRIKEAGELLGVRLTDSLILGDTGYYSFVEERIL